MSSAIKTSNNHDNLESKVFRKLARKTDEVEVYSHAHAERIAVLADEIGKALNLAPKDRQSLRAAGLLHDLGEASMRRDYLKRPSSLTDEERLDLARHPIIGEQEAAKAFHEGMVAPGLRSFTPASRTRWKNRSRSARSNQNPQFRHRA